MKNDFSQKHPIANGLKSFLVYKFTCPSCSSSYIGETCRHVKTRLEEHIKRNKKPDVFNHLHSTATCFDSYNSLCFKIIDKANSKFDLEIKETLDMNWRKPNLNAQENLLALTLSPQLLFPLLLSLFVFLLFFQHFSFIYCFHYLYANYRYLLLS